MLWIHYKCIQLQLEKRVRRDLFTTCYMAVLSPWHLCFIYSVCEWVIRPYSISQYFSWSVINVACASGAHWKELRFSWNVSWLCTLFPIATSEAAKKPRYGNDILSWRVRWKANSLLLAGRRFEVVQINSCRGLKVEGSSHFIVVTHSIPLLKRTTKNRLSWST